MRQNQRRIFHKVAVFQNMDWTMLCSAGVRCDKRGRMKVIDFYAMSGVRMNGIN